MPNKREPELPPEKDMSLAWEVLKSEMPREIEAASLAPMNPLERLLAQKGAIAVTWPWGRIAYNQELLNQDDIHAGDLLAHELIHVRQLLDQGPWRSIWRSMTAPRDYLSRDYEQEALIAEGQRRLKRRDIHLPAGRRR